ncbi:MAG: C-GCAxxG-C-C family protein [Lachnospiraceae bacterium]|nr:C-GCAxxG-C-C family protein [Lachnospiraceae bacterium]
MDRKELALEKHGKGYNCSQAVGCAFCDLMGMEESQVFQIMSAFGYGMGGMKGTCGAVSAGIAVIGMILNNGDTSDVKQKVGIHKVAKEYVRRFEEKNQSIICRNLKGVDTGEVLRSCSGCIEDAVDILEDMIKEGLLK